MKTIVRKKLTITSAIAVICLLFMSITVSATLYTTINNISYPTSAKIDSTFEVKVDFDYARSTSCIYGGGVYLKYIVKTENDTILASKTLKMDIVTNPRLGNPSPPKVVFSVDISLMELGEIKEDAIFRFQIKYTPGTLAYEGTTILPAGSQVSSEWYQLTITKGFFSGEIGGLPVWSIFLIGVGGIAVIAVVLFWKKRR